MKLTIEVTDEQMGFVARDPERPGEQARCSWSARHAVELLAARLFAGQIGYLRCTRAEALDGSSSWEAESRDA
jgi:hypothetical protein